MSPTLRVVAEVSSELHKAAYIIGHAIAGDLKWLCSIGVALDTAESKPDQNIVDTQTLAVACETRAMRQTQGQAGSHGGCMLPAVQQRSLLALATQYDLEPAALHNGANDAAFTLQVMLLRACDAPARAHTLEHAHAIMLLFRRRSCSRSVVCPLCRPYALRRPTCRARYVLRCSSCRCVRQRVWEHADSCAFIICFPDKTHTCRKAFQALQASASAVASVVDDLLSQLEAALRPHAQQALVDQVTRFAQALAEGADVSRYTHAGAAVAEVRFPAGLSAAERRLVHQTAQDKGLSSSSQGKGADRFITVRAAGGFPMHGAGPRDDSRRGRKAGKRGAVEVAQDHDGSPDA